MNIRKLSVGLLVDDGLQSSLIHDVIEKSKSAEHYSIDYLIVQEGARDKNRFGRISEFLRKQSFFKLIAAVCFKVMTALEVRLFVRDPKLKTAFDQFPLEYFDVEKISVRSPRPSDGSVYRYCEEDLITLKSLNIDVLVDGQSELLGGEILTISKFGLVALRRGVKGLNKSGPPGFWEVFDQEPSTDLIIQKLSDESDGGNVLMKASIPTKPTYAQNFAQINKKSNVFMHRFLEDLGMTRTLPRALAEPPYAHAHHTTPSLHVMALYQVKTFIIMTRKLFTRSSSADRRTISGKYDRWGVAYMFTEDWQDSVLSRSKAIANPPYRYLADPFVCRHGDLDVCFVEDYDFRTKKGKISVFKINGNQYEELGSAIDEPFHMSYPFIFTVDDELYMCPETGAINEIRLYRCTEFPLRWSFHKTLIKDVSAVDTDIFFYKDKWWLLTNIDSSEIGEVCSELHVFYADSFDSDAWTPHPKNPVIFDSERARNGGFFRDGEKLLRVFQRQGFDQYGESMGIAQINDLGTDTYCEETVSTIDPRLAPKVIGAHSFSFNDGLLAIDFLKVERVKAASG